MKEDASNWYYLLPIFLGLIGGIIMYFVLRTRDKDRAKNGLALGVVLFILHLGLSLVMRWI